MVEILVFLVVGVFSVMDIKYRKISKQGIVVVLVFVLCVTCINRGILPVIEGVLIGFCMCVVSMLLPKVIGIGDGLVFILLGSTLCLEEVIAVSVIAFIVAGVMGVMMLVLCKKSVHYELPFIPCIWVAYLGVIVFERWM